MELRENQRGIEFLGDYFLLAKGGFRVSCDCENKEEIFGGYLRVRGGGVGGES